MKASFSQVNLKIRSGGYTSDTIPQLTDDYTEFLKKYAVEGIGPAKLESLMIFSKKILPNIIESVIKNE